LDVTKRLKWPIDCKEFKRLIDFRHTPTRIGASWIEKTVTTDPPKYVPHTEYALVFRLESDIDILLALMLVDAGKGQFARSWRSKARREWKLRLSFFPMDWKRSDATQVNFEGLSTIADNADLKHDPRPFVRTRLLDGELTVANGSVLSAAYIDINRRIECRMLAVAKMDTDANRGRWTLKPALADSLPTELRFLVSGKTGGTF
jgi:hypothetical protein